MKKSTNILILVAIVLIGFTGCKKKAETTVAQQDFTIRTQQVTAQDVEQIYEYTATVEVIPGWKGEKNVTYP